MIITISYTGLRWGEAIGLERDYARPGEIHVEWQLHEIDGWFHRLPPKDDSYRSPSWEPKLPVDLHWLPAPCSPASSRAARADASATSPGMRGLYARARLCRMRDDLKQALQARWEESLRARATISPLSPVPLLDELLAAFRARIDQASPDPGLGGGAKGTRTPDPLLAKKVS